MAKSGEQLETELAATVKQLEAELAASNTHADLLQKRLDAVGSSKIPTLAALKAKGKGLKLTRAEQLHIDLKTALGMGKERITKFLKELQIALDKGLDVQKEMAEGRLPSLRYLIAVENEIHKYIKRGKRKMRTKDGLGTKMAKVVGGYRKGLSVELKNFAGTLLELMDRDKKKPVWDERIPVPGLERLDING